jgi:hypothetical protein
MTQPGINALNPYNPLNPFNPAGSTEEETAAVSLT